MSRIAAGGYHHRRVIPEFVDMPLVHPLVMLPIPIAVRIGRPAGPRLAPATQRILPGDAPQQAQRREHEPEQHAQQDARVDVAERLREAPPRRARPLQQPTAVPARRTAAPLRRRRPIRRAAAVRARPTRAQSRTTTAPTDTPKERSGFLGAFPYAVRSSRPAARRYRDGPATSSQPASARHPRTWRRRRIARWPAQTSG